MEPLDRDLDEAHLDLPSEPMLLNMGPSHPAMLGTVRIVLEHSGETINKADVQIGYLHRGFEKMCERGTWSQIFPYVDRCNYVSPMLNNVYFLGYTRPVTGGLSNITEMQSLLIHRLITDNAFRSGMTSRLDEKIAETNRKPTSKKANSKQMKMGLRNSQAMKPVKASHQSKRKNANNATGPGSCACAVCLGSGVGRYCI